MGSKSIKEKLQIVLNQRGNFQCPGNVCAQSTSVPSTNTQKTVPKPASAVGNGASALIDLVLADLKKRGASRPRKVSTLTSTIKALLKQHKKTNTDGEVSGLIAELQKRGKVMIIDTKVTYKLG